MSESYLQNKRSTGFTLASLILGILGLVTGCCVYPSIIFGALAIVFAILSKGGENTMSNQSKAGLIMGIIGLVCGIAMVVFALYVIFVQFGGIENYMEYYFEILEEMYPELEMNLDYTIPTM